MPLENCQQCPVVEDELHVRGRQDVRERSHVAAIPPFSHDNTVLIGFGRGDGPKSKMNNNV